METMKAAKTKTSTKVRVLVVPVEGPITTRDIEPTLDAIQEIVGGYYEQVTLLRVRSGRVAVLHVNEDGIGLGLPVNPRLTEAFGLPLFNQPLLGQGFIAAVIEPDFDYHGLTDDEAKAWSTLLMLGDSDGAPARGMTKGGTA